MPIYDFECVVCASNMEEIYNVSELPDKISCRFCGGKAVRVITQTGVYLGNKDATWVKSVRTVVDKKKNKPHCREFLQNPTRDNLQKWMDGEGVRPLEDNEPTEPPPFDKKQHLKHMMKARAKRHRLEI